MTSSGSYPRHFTSSFSFVSFYKDGSFLLHLVIHRVTHLVTCQVICLVICSVIRPVIHPVIRLVIYQVIPQLSTLLSVWLSDASQSDYLVSLSYPMAIFSVNEIRTFWVSLNIKKCSGQTKVQIMFHKKPYRNI